MTVETKGSKKSSSDTVIHQPVHHHDEDLPPKYEFHQGKSDQNGTKLPINLTDPKQSKPGCGLDPESCCGKCCTFFGENCGCETTEKFIIGAKRVGTRVALGLLLWGFFYAILFPEEEGEENDALPGGNIFGILMVFLFCIVGEALIVLLPLPFNLPPLPPLMASLFIGIALRNIPVIDIVGKSIEPRWSHIIREMALGIILGEAGLEVDKMMMNKLKFVVPRLAFSPCLIEAISWGVFAHLILGLDWIWSFMLGFVCGAVAPACVVPAMIKFQGMGLGMEHGVPTLLIAAASIDDIIAINGFNIIAVIPFAESSDIGPVLLTALSNICLGLVIGGVLGAAMWLLPDSRQHNIIRDRTVLLILVSWFIIFVTEHIDLPLPIAGAGTLGVLTCSFVASLKWPHEQVHAVGHMYKSMWFIFSPLLFGLTGANVDLSKLDGHFVGLTVATLAICLTIRLTVAGNSVSFLGWTHKEKFMTSISWIPKATVQAAIGGAALDMARKLCDPYIEDGEEWPVDCDGIALTNSTIDTTSQPCVDGFPTQNVCSIMIDSSEKILQVSVLVIMFTAPIGVWLIGIAGPRLLPVYHTPDEEAYSEKNEKSSISSFGVELESRHSKQGHDNEAIDIPPDEIGDQF